MVLTSTYTIHIHGEVYLIHLYVMVKFVTDFWQVHCDVYLIQLYVMVKFVTDFWQVHCDVYLIHLYVMVKVIDKLPSHKDVSGTPHNGPAKSH
jgi:hypothetical protein